MVQGPPRILRLHLRALVSYFTTANHPLSDEERATLLTRDFAHELRVTRDFLLCCTAIVSAVPGPHFDRTLSAGGSEAEAGHYLFEGAGALHSAGSAFDPQLPAVLRDLHLLCEGLLNARGVGFHVWTGLTRLALRQLEQTACPILRDDLTETRSVVPPELTAIAAQVAPDALSADVSAVFARLFAMLEISRVIETVLSTDGPLKQTLPLFTLLRGETRRLLDLLTERTLRIDGLDPAVHEYLDGVAYAIRMEQRKAFEHELVGLASLRHAPQIFGRVENAHGLLRDCFQQSVISVARAFDPQFDGAALFGNFKTKLEQSLQLRGELWGVLSAVRRAGEGTGHAASAELLVRLNSFREGGLRFLMYKDWEAFERFVEDASAAKSAAQLQPIFNRFQAFLETLFSQVSMRAVLADHPFVAPDTQD